MPKYPIERATNFIIEDESWSVIEYDHTSVPGTIYLSLTENKVNLIYDDLINDIADTDRLANYQLLVPEQSQNFNIGDIINPSFTLIKNGLISNAETELISLDSSIVKNIDGQLTAISDGETDICVRLKEFPTITNTLHITIGGQDGVSAYIEGPSSLRLDRLATYVLKSTHEINEIVTFALSNDLAKILNRDNNTPENGCIIKANDKNNLGNFTITAFYNGKTYTKTVTVIPLW